MKLKLFFITILLFVLTACIPIRVISKYNPDTYNGYKLIQGYQKADTVGHTDVIKRESDMLACGVRNLMGGNLDLNTQYPDMTDSQVWPRHKKIDNCMKSKGYIIIGKKKCTNKGKPTGLCN